MLRYLITLLLAALVQHISARGQKPGAMNEYDEETNTVFDEAPEDESFLGQLEELIFEDEHDSTKGARHHGSSSESDKHGTFWKTLKYEAKVVFTVIVLVLLVIAGFLIRRWWKKR